MEKKTPLYQNHIDGGGRIVPFAGYLLPVQYEGVIAEHMAARTKAGLFDVSHMAELVLKGPDALKNVNYLVTSNTSEMEDGQIKYGLLCNKQGGIVDDLMVYRQREDQYLLVVNAGNHEKDAAWIKSNLFGNVTMEDISESTAQIALQGPLSESVLAKLCDAAVLPSKYYTFKEGCVIKTSLGEVKALISRTGYTGEDGFEIWVEVMNTLGLEFTFDKLGN
jgi:aminomethyltransferase